MGSSSAALPFIAVLVGALAGGGAFLLILAIRGLPASAPSPRLARLEEHIRALFSIRGAIAIITGVVVLVATRWVVAGVGATLLVLGWRSLGGAAGERQSMARLEGLATWTESLRDTIAGAVGLEQAIPSSLRVAAPSLQEPLARLVDRMHTRMPLPDALRQFADDLNDPGADLIIAALIINARLRGPGLRDLLSALSNSVREELDMRRKVNAERRSTRRSVQIVVAVSVGLALGLAIFDHGYVHVYNNLVGQMVLIIVGALYAASFLWLRKLATYESPDRLLAVPAGGIPAGAPETVAAWRHGEGAAGDGAVRDGSRDVPADGATREGAPL
jgi:Flp pilus assembly protein TadB